MKVVILAGGMGTRLSEETRRRPKPMVEIGGRPILWHIMKIYSHYGFNDFVICLGYKGYMIKEYFSNYFLHNSDVTISVKNDTVKILNRPREQWQITLIDTGQDTMTGGRIKKVGQYLDDKTFLMTYGDGVCDINMGELVEFHKKHGKLATVTAVRPPGRFGTIKMENGMVKEFKEKPVSDGGLINGGFFVLEPTVLDYIKGNTTEWEKEPLEILAREGQLVAREHGSYWKCLDTLRDIRELEKAWHEGNPQWAVWEK